MFVLFFTSLVYYKLTVTSLTNDLQFLLLLLLLLLVLLLLLLLLFSHFPSLHFPFYQRWLSLTNYIVSLLTIAIHQVHLFIICNHCPQVAITLVSFIIICMRIAYTLFCVHYFIAYNCLFCLHSIHACMCECPKISINGPISSNFKRYIASQVSFHFLFMFIICFYSCFY